MDELLAFFMRNVLGLTAPAADYGTEFSDDRAREAYFLIRNTADATAEMRETAMPNMFGFFPRISLRDHGDIDLLLPIVDTRAAELKDALLAGAGAYAMGSNKLALEELHEVREEYLKTVRLSMALESEHTRWHSEQEEIKAATERATAAMPEPLADWERELIDIPAPATPEQTPADVENHRPIPSHQYTPESLAYIAGADEEIRAHAQDGKKIHAIKRLRTLTRCGLRDAKIAVETAFPASFQR